MQRQATRTRIRIVARDQLAQLLRETVGRRYPTQRAAANALGIHPSQYSRLLRGRAGAITPRTWASIAGTVVGIVPAAYLTLHQAILDPLGQELLDRYENWELDTAQIYAAMIGAPPASALRWLDGADSIMGFLRKYPLYRNLLEVFRQEVALRHGVSRADVSVNRILVPLLAAAWTDGVERSVGELHRSNDLHRYLQKALDAERILLRRSDALQRIYDLTADSSGTTGREAARRRASGTPRAPHTVD